MSDDAPVYPEEFIGWRGWKIDARGLLLSVNNGEPWTPGVEMTAECSRGRTHSYVPWKNCECGFYSVKTLTKLRQNGYHDQGVFGQVSIWGHVIDGGMGWRSEFCYPKVIYVPYLRWKVVEALLEYDVPVKLLNPYTGDPV